MKSHLRVHYFQHIAGEGFGSCYSFLKAHKAKITATEFFALPVDLPLELEALPRVDLGGRRIIKKKKKTKIKKKKKNQ